MLNVDIFQHYHGVLQQQYLNRTNYNFVLLSFFPSLRFDFPSINSPTPNLTPQTQVPAHSAVSPTIPTAVYSLHTSPRSAYSVHTWFAFPATHAHVCTTFPSATDPFVRSTHRSPVASSSWEEEEYVQVWAGRLS